MRIAIGADHGGFTLKKEISKYIRLLGYDVLDVGTDSPESVDYPDIAVLVGEALQNNQVDRGILICGSGVGVCIASNKITGVFAAICHDVYSAKQGVEHDNMNVICFGGRIVGDELAKILASSILTMKEKKKF